MVIVVPKKRQALPKKFFSQMGMAAAVVAVMFLLVSSIVNVGNIIDNREIVKPSPTHETPLAYGTKELGEKTGELVEQAIQTGFRHIVTAGHHGKNNETGTGIGWKASGVSREALFLQTSFVPFDEKNGDFKRQPSDPEILPDTTEEQVRLSVETSLKNLQTNYIDALVFNNNKAKRSETSEILKAWKVLEDYVDRGIILKLGITSIHDAEWFETFWNSTRIKPAIVQNRFHTNRKYDVNMQETFAKHGVWVQRFWLLNGSSAMGRNNKGMAEQKGVTAAQLMLGFVMSMGSQTCLVGTRKLQHMKDDVEIARCYPSLFGDDQQRQEYAKQLGMQQPSDRPLPGQSGIDFGNDHSRKCQSTQ